MNRIEMATMSLLFLVISVWVFYTLNNKKNNKNANEYFTSECKPECCQPPNVNSQLSCYGGCVCLDKNDQALLGSRGNNSNPFTQM